MNWDIFAAVVLGTGLGMIVTAVLARLSEIDATAEDIVASLDTLEMP